MKLLEDNIKENLCNTELSKVFCIWHQKVRSIENKIDKLNFITVKKLCFWKESLRRMKEKLQIGRNFCKSLLWSRLVSRIYKEPSKLKRNKIICIKNFNQAKYWTLLIIRKVKNINIMRYHYIAIEMQVKFKTDYTKCCQGCGAIEILIHCCWKQQNGWTTL